MNLPPLHRPGPSSILGAAFLCVVAMAAFGDTATAGASAARNPPDVRTVSAWLPYWNVDAGYADAVAHADQLHTVSPFWYRATSATSVKPYEGAADQRIVDGLHAAGVKVVPTVVETLKAPEMADLLDDPLQRTAHVESLMKVAEAHAYDGLDLDYERTAETRDVKVRERIRTGYNALAAQLCGRLQAGGKECVITVMPRTSTDGLAFDYKELGRVADRLRIMGYNLHNALGSPGPLSSLAWYEEFLSYASRNVPARKLEIALPGYGWDWTVGSKARAVHVTWKEAEALRVRQGAEYLFDQVSGTPHFTYTDTAGHLHDVWYQDGRGSAAHVAVARKYGITRTGLWALGFEDPALWRVLSGA